MPSSLHFSTGSILDECEHGTFSLFQQDCTVFKACVGPGLGPQLRPGAGTQPRTPTAIVLESDVVTNLWHPCSDFNAAVILADATLPSCM